MNQLTLAIIQSCSGIHQQDNFLSIKPSVLQAIERGAQLVSMPEAVNTMSQGQKIKHYDQQHDPFVLGMQQIAKEHAVWLHLGSVILKDGDKIYNRTLMINGQGTVHQLYNKIHMFDVEVAGQLIRESDSYTAGNDIVVAECPWGKTGLSICYDVRFPLIYRQLAQAGCLILMIPSAFTYTTGKAHWHTLLRARAIENSAWVIAANQCHHHQDGRHTFGHSLIINPWGEIVAEGSEMPEVVLATIDLTQVGRVRQQIPAWRL